MTVIRLAILAVFALGVGNAQANTLSGDEIRDLIEGKRIVLQVPLGGEFPLYYQRGGQVTGDGTALGVGRFFAPRETGRWWIDGNQMCQQWPTWYNGRPFCFTIQQTAEDRIRWNRNDGRSGMARITD